LDTLFPVEVERVLFIDADQIVRADVKELWNMDLEGNVYGFVPFCGSGPAKGWFSNENPEDLKNPETLGHRFWEQGFWKTHLGSGGNHYHISALFVVDLLQLRRIGGGDILRDVYQALTNDPHSLSNLDQDLPNYVQARQIPIFSLPQEWLWCETWCHEKLKSRAKTIDMCQNPVKKEGKLDSARRIAPEWTKYDDKLTKIIEEVNKASGK
jgi:UDP-glucose:glycoprotein glucosyltransferase